METAVKRLEGNNALVTGAARRIGRAISLALAREGANVAVHYSSSAREAEKLAGEIEALGVRAVALEADLSDSGALGELVDRAGETLGRLEILVNNASVFPSDTLETVELESLQENVRVNAWAPLVLTRAFAVQTERGHVVNLLDSRVSGFDRTHVAYILSKHVLSALTRMTALELAPGIAVNGIAPGLILAPAGEDESYVERLAQTLPLKRSGTPEDIAAAVVYLVTSEFVTGETIYVDGGRHLKESAE
ncbi:MAG: SDR family oxidoreductase [Gaiellaceae bacterium]|jgi:NAD(P)-dependent dehydrogenase (short-subunit alcohol dehydrogenase family)